MKTFKVLSIDAWAGMEDGSWEWNNWHNFGEYNETYEGELSDKNALRYFQSFLKDSSKISEYEIDDDQYNVILVRKSDNKPLLAIEYGSHF
jgi:hypothetical protein